MSTKTISNKDTCTLDRAIGDIYAARDLESFYETIFRVIREMIRYELCTFNVIKLSPVRFLKVIPSSQSHSSVISKNLPALNAYTHTHPLIARFTSDGVFKTTDVVSMRQFKAMAIYNEYYRLLGTETQIFFSMPMSPDTVSIVALSRNSTDFSERDRLLLTLLKPHFINALRNVTELGRLRLERDLLNRGEQIQKQGTVLCSQNGMIIGITTANKYMN